MRRSLNNRPLRSVLANRKLFQGGGMVGMGNPMAMANMQPAGILASSPNLINSVVGDAVNPQGGPTLSMADGGIARFREGGANDLRRQVQYALSIKPDEMYETPGGLHTSNEEVITLLQRLDPNNPIYADVANAAKERGLPIPKPRIQVAEAPRAISSDDQTMPSQAERDAILAQDPGAGLIQAAEEAGPPLSGPDPNIPEFLSEQLLAEGEIEAAVAPAAFDTEEGVGIIPADQVSKASVLERGIYYDPERIAVFPQTLEKVTDNLFYDYEDENFHQPTPDLLSKDEAPSEGVAGYGPRGGQKAAMEEAGEAINRAFDATADAEDVADQEPEIEYAPRGGSETAMEKAAKDFAAAEAITPRAPRKKSAIEAKHQDPDDFDIDAASAEFLSRMPAYEGDTSGMNLIVLGAAIMEGESEHWAVNVGKGLTKAMPLFIKDKKDREAFDRSVQMAATKYGLSKRDTIETERRALERTKNNYYLDRSIQIIIAFIILKVLLIISCSMVINLV